MGTKTKDICVLIDVTDITEIESKIGIKLLDPILQFPHAVLISEPNIVLSISDMHKRVF